MTITVLEAAAMSDGSIRYRFVCPACSPKVEGAWQESLSDAERSAERHKRMHHPPEAVQA